MVSGQIPKLGRGEIGAAKPPLLQSFGMAYWLSEADVLETATP